MLTTHRQDLAAMGDRAFDADLNSHLREEDISDAMDEWIEARAAELRKQHGPFSMSDIGEAIDSGHGKEVAELYGKPLETQLELMEFALATINAIEEYWGDHFKEMARIEYFSECRF